MKERKRIRLLIVSAYLFTGMNFIADIYTAHGIATWVLYVPIVLTPVWYNNPRHVVWVTAGCSVLVVIGFFLSPPGIEYFWAVMNRVFILATLWMTAVAGIVISNRSVQVAEALTTLEREIVQRKQIEKELRETDERLRLAMHGVGMGTWGADLRTSKEVWSESLFWILGYEPLPNGAATSEMWMNRVHPDDRCRVVEAEEQAQKEHRLYHQEYRICRSGQENVAWIEVFGLFQYDEADEPVRFVGVCFDITPRKDLESEMLEITARQQQDIGQELHDGVGQELTGLGLIAQSLAQRLPEDSAEKTIAVRLIAGLDQVHQKARELSRGLIPVQVEAGGLAAALNDLAARTTEQSGVSVTAECPDWVAMPDHVTATQMFRIAQEAVTNALRHGRPRHIRMSLLPEPSELRLRVNDDGMGVQGKAEKGDGLGLRIMKYRAGLIGGALHFGSSAGGGATVTFTLPWSKRNDEKVPESCAGQGANLDRG